MTVSRLTKLDAVNQILVACGYGPVNSIEGNASKWTRIAVFALEEADRRIQSEGWYFNTDPNVTLAVEAGTGKIPLPINTITFKVHHEPYFQVREGYMYDRREQTFEINRALQGELQVFLDFDELPEYAKRYVVAVAARKMYESHVGSNDNRQNLYREELEAKATLMDQDFEAAQYSMMTPVDIPILWGSEYVPGSPRRDPLA